MIIEKCHRVPRHSDVPKLKLKTEGHTVKNSPRAKAHMNLAYTVALNVLLVQFNLSISS